ncbi:MAG TPA: L,D-transpeptidase [Gemmatimonadaceae bacterium]|nr:L,D-transpeptidase [Gemmatimonadaceae bacterium]
MAVAMVDLSWKKALALAGAAAAGLLSLPGVLLAQAQRMSGDWLQLTPSDPKTPIGGESRSAVVTASDDSTTVSIERRSKFRSRKDSVAGMTAYEASKRDKNLHVSVSLEDRKLYVVAGQDTVMEAPIAIGSGQRLVFGERAWQFDTPRGIRTIRGKDEDPEWTPPDWHYAETAKEYGLKLAHLSLNKSYPISGGRKISFQDGEAGIVHPDSGFMFLPLEEEIVFDETLFIPPVGSKNRKIQGQLGKYKLDTGGGILLHGTPHKNSIGQAATHGCLRLRDEDIEWLYSYVPIGTKIYIY